eukprot:COSAG01_NODE_145_length_24103_cov_41.178012_30_plen_49_part_00
MGAAGRLGAAEGFKTRVPLVGRSLKTPSAAPSLPEAVPALFPVRRRTI